MISKLLQFPNIIKKCIVTLFEARGPKEPQEALRGAAARPAGTFWTRGDAARGLGTALKGGALKSRDDAK